MGDRARDPGAVSACVLLAGAIKPSPLVTATGFSTLDLLTGPDESLLDRWILRLRAIGIAAGEVIAVHGSNIPSPTASAETIAVRIRRERDHLRGPAGAAHDACQDLAHHDTVLIAEAKRDPGASLEALVQEWDVGDADIIVARNPSGSPAGLYIARRELLDLVPNRGFMDLKEQWLGAAIGQGARVRVVDIPPPGTLPVRILPQYLRLVLSEGGATGFTTGVIEASHRRVALVSPAATVDPGADVIDSVVMEGARVGAGALVVRCLVCPGARVEPGAEVVDAVITETGVRSDKIGLATAGFSQGWG